MTRPVLAALKKKQDELYALADTFQELRSFAFELRRATKNKQFDVRSSLAWESSIALYRILVIDLRFASPIWPRGFVAAAP